MRGIGAEDGARLHRRFSGDIKSLVAVIQQEVALFDSTAEARRYMSGLRERVRACPSMPVDHGSGPDRSYRFRLLVKTEREVDLQGSLRSWLARCPKVRGNTRVSIDVDPQSFL